MVEFRAAVRLSPSYAMPHDGLGTTLLAQAKFDEAVTERREAVRLKPDFALARSNLSAALYAQGKFDEAVAEARVALQSRPDVPEAHCNLGLALRGRGDFDQAVIALRKGRDLARLANPDLAHRVGPVLSIAERQATLLARLPAILAGTMKPDDPGKTLDFAEICYKRGPHGASARLWADAFQADPKLADDVQASLRYNAACAAALAGCGRGKDERLLDDGARSRWRQQARQWVEADRAAWSKTLQNGSLQSRQTMIRTLKHWKADLDLAGLRDGSALARLPTQEQVVCRALWARVDALLATSRAGSSK